MDASQIKSVCVVGTGTMGGEISLRCALYGFKVLLVAAEAGSLQSCQERQRAILTSGEELPGLSFKDPEEVLSRIHPTFSLKEGLDAADYVIEAVPEKLELKRQVFAEMDKIARPEIVLGTTSSSIRSSLIEDATTTPERVLNTHWYHNNFENPIIDIMSAKHTSLETMQTAAGLARRVGLMPLILKKESRGFIFNRVWRAIKKECMRVVDEGVSDPDDVDRVFRIYFKALHGPFEEMDEVGLDVALNIEQNYYRETGDEKDKPPQVLLDKVARNELGKKTGKGWYDYPNPRYLQPGWLMKEEPKGKE
jgi:3-hydroxybutyryl-CoA dehydrogenase